MLKYILNMLLIDNNNWSAFKAKSSIEDVKNSSGPNYIWKMLLKNENLEYLILNLKEVEEIHI